MHPRITELLTYLDTQRTALEQAIEAIPPTLRGQRPAPERWSVAEVVAHLAAVEDQVTQLLRTKIESARAGGLGPERNAGAVIPTVELTRILDRSRRITASAAAQPRASVDPDVAWADLVARRVALTAVVTAADGLALEQVIAPNPVLGPLNAYQWVVFIGGHEARHTAQIHETAAELARQSGITKLGADDLTNVS